MTVQQKQCRRDSELKRQMMKLIACSAVIIICTWVALKTWIVVGCLLILWMWYMDMRRQGKGSTTVTILIIMTSLVKFSTFLLPFGFPNFPANPYHSQMAKPPHPLFRNTVSHLNSHVFRFQTGWSNLKGLLPGPILTAGRYGLRLPEACWITHEMLTPNLLATSFAFTSCRIGRLSST